MLRSLRLPALDRQGAELPCGLVYVIRRLRGKRDSADCACLDGSRPAAPRGGAGRRIEIFDVDEGVTGMARLCCSKGLDAVRYHERILKADEGRMQTNLPADRAGRSFKIPERETLVRPAISRA